MKRNASLGSVLKNTVPLLLRPEFITIPSIAFFMMVLLYLRVIKSFTSLSTAFIYELRSIEKLVITNPISFLHLEEKDPFFLCVNHYNYIIS
uniref:Uncharacterized protein n=1 Tax=Onchocerca volvulus TaxID=6282 RepID=A0A8R1Y311_ONCVO